jgi:hypothetical protein
MSARPRLTDAIENQICLWVRSGALPHVAAEAEGVPREVFQQWLTWGTRKSPRPLPRYRRFAQRVRTAAAVCRVRVEIQIREKDPKFWLLSGPGKEQPGYPGWTTAVKALPPAEADGVDLFADPGFIGLVHALLAALAPFPEARKVAAQALQEFVPAVGAGREESPSSPC